MTVVFSLFSWLRDELEKFNFKPFKQEANSACMLLSNCPSECIQSEYHYLCRYQIHHQSHPPQCKTGTSAQDHTWHHPYPRQYDSKSPPEQLHTLCSSHSHPAPCACSAQYFCMHYCHRDQGNLLRISHSRQLQRARASGGVWATRSLSCLAGVNAPSQRAGLSAQPAGASCRGKQRYRIQSGSCTHQPTSLWAL